MWKYATVCIVNGYLASLPKRKESVTEENIFLNSIGILHHSEIIGPNFESVIIEFLLSYNHILSVLFMASVRATILATNMSTSLQCSMKIWIIDLKILFSIYDLRDTFVLYFSHTCTVFCNLKLNCWI